MRIEFGRLLGLVSGLLPCSLMAQAQLGLPADPQVRVERIVGHDQPLLGRPTAATGVFHERFMVDPLSPWSRRGAGTAKAGLTSLEQIGARARRVTPSSSVRPGTATSGSAGVVATSGSVIMPRQILAGTMTHAVVLVEFADDSIGPDSLVNRVFPVGSDALMEAYYGTGGGRTGWTPVPTFFREASGGKFAVRGQLVARIRLPRSQAYYVIGDQRTGANFRQINWIEFLRTAAALLDAQISESVAAQFTEQTLRGATFGPIVFFHPGIDGACGPRENIWAHRSLFPLASLSNGPGFTIRGRAAGDYIMQGSRCGSNKAATELVGPGIVIHETGHLIGLSDLYNTAGGDFLGGVQTWDIMAGYSSFATPSVFGAFNRAILGWAIVREMTLPSQGAISTQLASSLFSSTGGRDTVLAVRYSTNPSELLLVEHRPKLGVDATIPDAGGLLWYLNLDKVYPADWRPGGSRTANTPLPPPNNNAKEPGLIVIPQGATTWRVDAQTGRPFIETSSLTQQARELSQNVTWGGAGRQTSFRPGSTPMWRSFITGEHGAVLEGISWNGQTNGPLRLTLRAASGLDLVGPVAFQSVAADTARPIAGLAWAGARVTATGQGLLQIRRAWSVVDSQGVTGVRLAFNADSTAVTVTGTVAETATSLASVTVRLERRDGVRVVMDSVPVPLARVVVRPFTAITEAAMAHLRQTLSADAKLFLDARGNKNGQVDLGDLHLLLARGIVTP